ncbi:MAG: hypothetical protein HGA40_02390 [Methanoregulaceae archaeon]|nr:hypothetical protein [Methanoregulaceae archaeon]
MPGNVPHARVVTGDLNQQESEAVKFFLTYMDDVQHILRNPRTIQEREEWGSFQAFISHLDCALSKSTVSQKVLLYHGISPDLAGTLLFMLDVNPLLKEGTVSTEFIPHLILDPGYTLFTLDPGTIIRNLAGQKRETGVIFTYSGGPGDSAIVLGKESGEMLYPRNSAWVTTGYTAIRWGTTRLIIISLEKYRGGGGLI